VLFLVGALEQGVIDPGGLGLLAVAVVLDAVLAGLQEGKDRGGLGLGSRLPRTRRSIVESLSRVILVENSSAGFSSGETTQNIEGHAAFRKDGSMNYLTSGQIAKQLGIDRDAVAYALRKLQINPVAHAGIVRLFPKRTASRVRDFLGAKHGHHKYPG
jgi:hypothetical protein